MVCISIKLYTIILILRKPCKLKQEQAVVIGLKSLFANSPQKIVASSPLNILDNQSRTARFGIKMHGFQRTKSMVYVRRKQGGAHMHSF